MAVKSLPGLKFKLANHERGFKICRFFLVFTHHHLKVFVQVPTHAFGALPRAGHVLRQLGKPADVTENHHRLVGFAEGHFLLLL